MQSGHGKLQTTIQMKVNGKQRKVIKLLSEREFKVKETRSRMMINKSQKQHDTSINAVQQETKTYI